MRKQHVDKIADVYMYVFKLKILLSPQAIENLHLKEFSICRDAHLIEGK